MTVTAAQEAQVRRWMREHPAEVTAHQNDLLRLLDAERRDKYRVMFALREAHDARGFEHTAGQEAGACLGCDMFVIGSVDETVRPAD